jgi:hypothetical protein
MVMETKTRTLEELEAELARQDEELARASAAFLEKVGNARFHVPSSFFEELEEITKPRPSPSLLTHFVFGLRA